MKYLFLALTCVFSFLSVQKVTPQEETPHIPLLIFADPKNHDSQSPALQITLCDIARSSMNPVIVLNASLLHAFVQDANISHGRQRSYNFNASIFQEKYAAFDVQESQFIILIPHTCIKNGFFKQAIQVDRLCDITQLLTTKKELLETLEYKLKKTSSSAAYRFVDDFKKIFLSTGYKKFIWDIWMQGHGLAKGYLTQYPTYGSIVGLPLECFLSLIDFFSTEIMVGSLFLESCYVGGVNTNIVAQQTDALPFNLFVETTGETVTYASNGNSRRIFLSKLSIILHAIREALVKVKDHPLKTLANCGLSISTYLLDWCIPKMFWSASEYLHLIETFFETAATQDLHKFTHSLRSRLNATYGSLHGSEYTPQCKYAASRKFEFLNDDSWPIVCIPQTDSPHHVEIPTTAHTVIFDTQHLQSLVLHQYEKTVDTHQKHKKPASAFSYTFNPSCFPTFIVKPQGTDIKHSSSLRIDKLTLVSNDAEIGIDTFFRSAFLTMLNDGKVSVSIGNLRGIDDLSTHYFLHRFAQTAAAHKARFSETNNYISLTDVMIYLDATTLFIDFRLDRECFRLKFAVQDGEWRYEPAYAPGTSDYFINITPDKYFVELQARRLKIMGGLLVSLGLLGAYELYKYLYAPKPNPA